jgi:hypothetical protein
MKRLAATVVAASALLAFASPAAAHLLAVNSPGGGNAVHDHWVGGGPGGAPIPGQGEGLFEGRDGPLPAAHGTGLVNACESLKATPAAASILAPGRTGTCCHHGD